MEAHQSSQDSMDGAITMKIEGRIWRVEFTYTESKNIGGKDAVYKYNNIRHVIAQDAEQAINAVKKEYPESTIWNVRNISGQHDFIVAA